jgi:hypothetical protein
LPPENPTGLVVKINIPSIEDNGWFVVVVVVNTSTESMSAQAYKISANWFMRAVQKSYNEHSNM